MTVQVIEATRPAAGAVGARPARRAASAGKLRVAAYCRVSTTSEEQETSYEAQRRHYTDLICANPAWELADIYADEGISGTTTRRREQFCRLMADCEAGLVDMVLTKSISRWARNTIDSLDHIRRLKALGIPVLFEKEGINTMDTAGEVLITILSSLAQQESESISQNVRLGIQYQMQQGKPRLNTSRLLGLERDPRTGRLVAVPGEADVVRRIYREYLEGYGPGRIALRLTRDGVAAPGGGTTWHQRTVTSILANEKYCGDLLMQKYFVADVLTHRVVRNEGQLPRYLVRGDHEPVVPREVYARAQAERMRRSALGSEAARLRFGAEDALVGRLVCGLCGRTLKRCVHADSGLVEWRCLRRATVKKTSRDPRAKCACRGVNEAEARHAVMAGMDALPQMRGELGELLREWSGRARERSVRAREQPARAREFHGAPEACAALNADCAEAASTSPEIDRAEEAASPEIDRAEAARSEVLVRSLLQLADHMHAMGTPGIAGTVGPTRMLDATGARRTPDAPSAAGMPHAPGAADSTGAADAAGATDAARLFVGSSATKVESDGPASTGCQASCGGTGQAEREGTGRGSESGASCSDFEDFFARTRYVPADGVLDASGRICAFDDDMVTRFVRSVVVRSDGYEVNFKAGLTVRVGM